MNNLQYEKIMLATGIMLKKRHQTTISLRHLEFLKAALQENMTIHITRAFLQNKNHYFICVNSPIHSTPSKQVRANSRQTQNDGEEEVEQVVEPPVDCQVIPVEEVVNNEPMLVDEEVVEEQQQEQLQPYQLTVFYRTQLIHFEQAFLQWVNDHYDHERRNFDQQQEEQYGQAMLLNLNQQQQEQQILADNIPLVCGHDVGADEVHYNNIIIDNNEEEDDGNNNFINNEGDYDVDDIDDINKEQNNNIIIPDVDDVDEVEENNVIIHGADDVDEEEVYNNNIINVVDIDDEDNDDRK